MTGDALRTQLAEVAARHHPVIGVDERTVMCTCGWSSTDDVNLRAPFGLYGLHVADALLALQPLARARAEGAAEALRVEDSREASTARLMQTAADYQAWWDEVGGTDEATPPDAFFAGWSAGHRHRTTPALSAHTTEGDPT